MRRIRLTPEVLDLIANRFRVLGEPARLRILTTLRSGEQSVGALVDATGLSIANLSRHLQLLHAAGFVTRHKEGLHVIYALTTDDVFRLCDIMCGQLEAAVKARRSVLTRN
jgi:ArsR family transcriptional regulator